MSKINDRSLQLKLIYNDEDLRKPDHDQIMKMLDAWLRVPENLLSMVRQLSVRYQLLPTPFENEVTRKLGWDEAFRSAQLDFAKDHTTDRQEVEEPWLDEPRRPIKLDGIEWEDPMFGGEAGGRRTMPVGFFDLHCWCSVAHGVDDNVDLSRQPLHDGRRRQRIVIDPVLGQERAAIDDGVTTDGAFQPSQRHD